MNSAALQLRVFTGDPVLPDTDAPSANDPRARQRLCTLREAFADVTHPRLLRQQRADGSIAKYRKAIWYWEAFWRVRNNVDPDSAERFDPPLESITADDLDLLPVVLLRERFGINTTTSANQQQTYVEAILRTCGPRIGRRGGVGILDEILVGQRLPAEAPSRRRRFADEGDLDRIDRACRRVRGPHGCPIPPPLLWRCAFRLLFNLGLRRNELFLLPRVVRFGEDEIPSVWTRPEHPLPDLDAVCQHGWLVYHTPKTRHRKRGLPHVVPLNAVTRDALDALVEATGNRHRLLPVGDHPSLWRKWSNRAQSLAGLERPYCFQEFRRTCNRAVRRHSQNREIARFILGHQPRGVNAEWYDNLTEDAVAAAQTLTQPNAFLQPVRE